MKKEGYCRIWRAYPDGDSIQRSSTGPWRRTEKRGITQEVMQGTERGQRRYWWMKSEMQLRNCQRKRPRESMNYRRNYGRWMVRRLQLSSASYAIRYWKRRSGRWTGLSQSLLRFRKQREQRNVRNIELLP